MHLSRRNFLSLLGISPVITSIPINMDTRPLTKVYKVTDSRGRSSYIRPHLGLHYEVGKLTKAEIGKIFCFSSINEAVDFYPVRETNSYRLFEAYTKSAERGEIYNRAPTNKENLENFWNTPSLREYYSPLETECIYCDELYLSKEIKI